MEFRATVTSPPRITSVRIVLATATATSTKAATKTSTGAPDRLAARGIISTGGGGGGGAVVELAAASARNSERLKQTQHLNRFEARSEVELAMPDGCVFGPNVIGQLHHRTVFKIIVVY